MRALLAVLLSAACLSLAGCSTVSRRIEEKSAVFNTLDPQAQARIRQGQIDIGYTQDMVYMALGRPDRTRERATDTGHEQTWIYNTYWQEYEGTHLAGYRRHAYFDRRSGTWRVYYEPVHVSVFRDREEEAIRVTFKDGKVSAIEQTKS